MNDELTRLRLIREAVSEYHCHSMQAIRDKDNWEELDAFRESQAAKASLERAVRLTLEDI